MAIDDRSSDLYLQRLKRKKYDQEHSRDEKNEKHRPVIYTEPLPPNTNPDVFQYVFGASCSLDFFGSQIIDQINIIKSVRCNIPWEEARFLIEKRHGLFDVRQRKANLLGSYVQGFLWEPHFKNWRKESRLIQKDRMMTHLDRVIIVIKPLKHGSTFYVPSRYKTELEEMKRAAMTEEEKNREEKVHKFIELLQTSPKIREDMSEDDKIKSIMDQLDTKLSLEQLKDRMLKKNRRSQYQQQFHPSDLEMDPTLIKPPPSYYVCHRCGEKGHWKHMCRSNNNINFVPPTQPRVPTGIPKSLLREAKTDEERQTSMVTDDGRLVVMAMKSSFASIFSSTVTSTDNVDENKVENEEDDDTLYYDHP